MPSLSEINPCRGEEPNRRSNPRSTHAEHLGEVFVGEREVISFDVVINGPGTWNPALFGAITRPR